MIEAVTEIILNKVGRGPAGKMREIITDTRLSQKHYRIPEMRVRVCVDVCEEGSSRKGPEEQ